MDDHRHPTPRPSCPPVTQQAIPHAKVDHYFPHPLRLLALASLYTALFLKDLGNRRFVPLASILVPFIPWALHFLTHGIILTSISLICVLFTIALVADTLRVTWSGRHLALRTLRIISGAFAGYFIAMLFQGMA